MIALERSSDEAQYAANWLLTNGYKELERMEQDAIRRSKMEHDLNQAVSAEDDRSNDDHPLRIL